MVCVSYKICQCTSATMLFGLLLPYFDQFSGSREWGSISNFLLWLSCMFQVVSFTRWRCSTRPSWATTSWRLRTKSSRVTSNPSNPIGGIQVSFRRLSRGKVKRLAEWFLSINILCFSAWWTNVYVWRCRKFKSRCGWLILDIVDSFVKDQN